jgi:hypothetical protein
MVAKLCHPGSARSVMAENPLLKQQLIMLRRGRRRARRLTLSDRMLRPMGIDICRMFDAAIHRQGVPTVDAIDRRGRPSRHRARRAPKAFAKAVRSTPVSVFPAIGEGNDVRLTGTVVSGAALVAGGRVIHLCAFPVADRMA